MKYDAHKHKGAFLERGRNWAANNQKTLLIALFALALLTVITQLKDFFIIALLMVIGAGSTFYKRKVRLPVGFELVIFSTVAVSIFYGPFVGAVFGALTQFLSSVVAKEVDPGMFVSLMAAAIVGIAPFFILRFNPGFSIVLIGLGMTLLFDLITQPFAMMLVGENEQKMKSLLFITTHLLFNYIIFKFFAPILQVFLGLQ